MARWTTGETAGAGVPWRVADCWWRHENPKRRRYGFLIWGKVCAWATARPWWASYSPSLSFILILNLDLSWVFSPFLFAIPEFIKWLELK
jgi:hypothetical protein